MIGWLAWLKNHALVELVQHAEYFCCVPTSLSSHRPNVPVIVTALKQTLSLPAWVLWQVGTLLSILGFDYGFAGLGQKSMWQNASIDISRLLCGRALVIGVIVTFSIFTKRQPRPHK